MFNKRRTPNRPPEWNLSDLQPELGAHLNDPAKLSDAFDAKVEDMRGYLQEFGRRLSAENFAPNADTLAGMFHEQPVFFDELSRLSAFRKLYVDAHYRSPEAQEFGQKAAKSLDQLYKAGNNVWQHINLSAQQIDTLAQEVPWLKDFSAALQEPAQFQSPPPPLPSQAAPAVQRDNPQELYNSLNSDTSKPLPERAEMATRMFNARAEEVKEKLFDRGVSPLESFADNSQLPLSFVEQYVNAIPQIKQATQAAYVDHSKMPTYSWREAVDIVTTAFDKLHPEMGDIARMAVADGWVHARPDAEKFHNAYSHGNNKAVQHPAGHPYVLMNFDKGMHGVETLAHELGHAIVQYLEGDQQILTNGQVIRPTGELAVSLDAGGNHIPIPEKIQTDTRKHPLPANALHETFAHFAEHLVKDEMIARQSDPVVKQNLINHRNHGLAHALTGAGINQFEQALYQAAADGRTMTTGDIATMYRQSQDTPSHHQKSDEETVVDAGRITHLINHTPHYYLGYAMAEVGAQNMIHNLKEMSPQERQQFGQQWVEVMRDAGSYTYGSAMEKVGVDFKDTAKTIQPALSRFQETAEVPVSRQNAFQRAVSQLKQHASTSLPPVGTSGAVSAATSIQRPSPSRER